MLATLDPVLVLAGGVVLGALLATLGLALAWGRVRRVLRALTDAVARLAAGDWPPIPAASRRGAVGRLARELAAMSTRFQSRVATLEQRLAAQAADAAQHEARLVAVAGASQQLIAAAGGDDWLPAALCQLSEPLGFYHLGVFLLDDAREAVALRAASSAAGQRLLESGYQVLLAESPHFDAVVTQGQPRLAVGPLPAPASDLFPETRAVALLPLRTPEAVLGVLEVHATTEAAFPPGELAGLQLLADVLSLAWRGARLAAPAKTSLDEIQRLLRAQDEAEQSGLAQVPQHWSYSYDGVEVKPAGELPPGDRAPQWVLPFQGGREALGELRIFGEAAALDAQDLDLARAVVEQAGRAMESAQLFSKMQTALEEVGVLYRCSQALGAARTEEQILRAFVDYLIPPPIDRCVLAVIEPGTTGDNMLVRLAAAWDAGKAHSPLLGDRWEVGRIPVMTRTTATLLTVADVATTPDLDDVSRQVFQEVLHLRSLLLAPLVAGGQLWGWLLAASQRAPYHFTERELRVYRSLVDQAALVLQSIRLVEEATQRADRERRLTDITAQIRRQMDVDTILQTAVRELGRTLRASDGLIRLGFGMERRIGHTQPLSQPAEAEDKL